MVGLYGPFGAAAEAEAATMADLGNSVSLDQDQRQQQLYDVTASGVGEFVFLPSPDSGGSGVGAGLGASEQVIPLSGDLMLRFDDAGEKVSPPSLGLLLDGEPGSLGAVNLNPSPGLTRVVAAPGPVPRWGDSETPTVRSGSAEADLERALERARAERDEARMVASTLRNELYAARQVEKRLRAERDEARGLVTFLRRERAAGHQTEVRLRRERNKARLALASRKDRQLGRECEGEGLGGCGGNGGEVGTLFGQIPSV